MAQSRRQERARIQFQLYVAGRRVKVVPRYALGLHLDPPPGSGSLLFRIRRVENCLRQPGARTWRSAVATPFTTAGEAPRLGERHDLAELLVQGAQRAEFGPQRGEKLALQVVKNCRQVGHLRLTLRTPSLQTNRK